MATQDGLLKLKGSAGEFAFFKTKDGYMARKRTGITGERLLTDPAYIRTRENLTEFTEAAKAAKWIRLALRKQLVQGADKRIISRLVKAVMRVVHSDPTSVRGKRNVTKGKVELLQGFEFNENGKLGQALLVPFV